jgi:hypothetical protein
MSSLLERYQKLRSVHPITLESVSAREASDLLIQALTRLEALGYVLLETHPSAAYDEEDL